MNKFLNIFAITLLVFLFVCLSAEITCRIAGIPKDRVMFKELSIGEKKFFISNPDFVKTIFRGIPAPPALPFSIFPREKPPSVFRVFVLGESSVAGFPYLPPSSFPSLADFVLNRIGVGKKCEVINCGITAITSKHVAEMAAQVLKYQPDCIVIYAGHNEMYGIGGAASSMTPQLQPFAEPILNLRIVRLLHSVLPEGRNATAKRNLLEQQARKKVSAQQKKYALKTFQSNLDRAITLCKKAGVPLILCTVVRNEMDYAPFGNGAAAPELRNLLKSVDCAAGIGAADTANGLSTLDSIIRTNANEPLPRYLKGKALGKSGRFKEARILLDSAIDLDCVPVRAPGEINGAIRSLAGQYNVALLDIEELVRRQIGADGIIDHRLLLDYLHFNYRGNLLVGSILAGFLSDRFFNISLPVDTLMRKAGPGPYDAYDDVVATGTIQNMCLNWPFENKDCLAPFAEYLQNRTDSLNAGLDSIEQAAFKTRNPKETYEFYSYLSQQYFSRQEYAKAKQVLSHLLEQVPIDPGINKTMGILAINEKKYKEAYQYIKLSYDINPDPKTYEILKGFSSAPH
jgi:tetratricopeptide (TPR) repeat protein